MTLRWARKQITLIRSLMPPGNKKTIHAPFATDLLTTGH